MEDDQERLLSQKSDISQVTEFLKNYNIFSFDKALRKAANRGKDSSRGCCSRFTIAITCGCTFQVLLFLAFLCMAVLGGYIQYGQAFFEKEPSHFECYHDEDDSWHDCSKKEICSQGVPKDHYRTDHEDPDYLDNWVEQYDLLCEPKWKIGLIGSVFYFGVMVTIIPLPWLSDIYGRKYVVTLAYLVYISAVIGLMSSHELMWLYIFLFVCGMTFGARVIAATNYILEFHWEKIKELIIFLRMLSGSIIIIVITFLFQFVTKSWLTLCLAFVILCAIGVTYIFIFVPESPLFLFGKKRFEESRQSMKVTADFNQVEKVNGKPYEKFKFTEEINLNQGVLARIERSSQHQQSSNSEGDSADLKNEKKSVFEQFRAKEFDRVAEENLTRNTFLMTVMWTVSTLTVYMLLYLNKYLAGGIYIQYYFDGISGILAYSVGKLIYEAWRVKVTFIISFIITLIGVLGIFLLEAEIMQPYFIDSLGCPPSGYEPESPKDRDYHMAKVIPVFSFLAKVGCHVSFLAAYYASFSDPKIFPLEKRGRQIGICNFVARGVTIFASLFAELDKPYPSLILTTITVFALVTSFFFDSMEDEENLEKEIREKHERLLAEKMGGDEAGDGAGEVGGAMD